MLMTSQVSAERRQKIGSIQVLRGVAATLVAGFHLHEAQHADRNFGPFTLFARGDAGVDIFFVISGFIIFYTSTRNHGLGLWDFCKYRFWRIVPPYWSILTLYIIAALALYFITEDRSNLPDWRSFIVSYLILPCPGHIINVAWTLSIEILFYVLFALTFFTRGERGFFVAALIWAMAAPIYGYQTIIQTDCLGYILHGAAFQFVIGAFVAKVYIEGWRRYRDVAFVAGIAAMSGYLLGGFERSQTAMSNQILLGASAALIIYGVLDRSWWIPPCLTLWGEASYILYLSHIFIFSVSGKAVELLIGFDVYGSPVALLTMLVGALGFSGMTTYYIERPYRNWYRRVSSTCSGGFDGRPTCA